MCVCMCICMSLYSKIYMLTVAIMHTCILIYTFLSESMYLATFSNRFAGSGYTYIYVCVCVCVCVS